MRGGILGVTKRGFEFQMKGKENMKILKIGGVLLLAAATVFFGFHFFFGKEQAPTVAVEKDDEEDAKKEEELAYYRMLSETLETQLTELRQDQYTASQAYEERISELELLLQKQEETQDQPTKPESPKTVYTYTVENDEVTINGYRGDATVLSIPSHIDGLPVTAIGREAFKNSVLTEVTVPNTVKKIDWFAFYGSGQLAKVVLPESVTKIEYGVFDGCSKVTIHCVKNSYADRYAKSYGMRIAN